MDLKEAICKRSTSFQFFSFTLFCFRGEYNLCNIVNAHIQCEIQIAFYELKMLETDVRRFQMRVVSKNVEKVICEMQEGKKIFSHLLFFSKNTRNQTKRKKSCNKESFTNSKNNVCFYNNYPDNLYLLFEAVRLIFSK